ncbi:hypothetical protein SAMN05216229_101259 [Geopseudomonas sagittaria]|uniref:SPOR domain-containing protein n=1 Tax=Geopseudomonas sagittaria TaxID=1135990 RepID=A0A1I5P0H3_9GAMM|nr:hypothetical protein [Pseudomonas sagittaria]SFP27493.1 hypothetical protein SAMN05216229_101259 [Pseudomonas sagittaria]
MIAFTIAGGFSLYHYVQHSDQPRYPYGVCGPFTTEAEASEALERITAVFPAAALHIEEAGFAGDAGAMLAQDHANARQRLAQLRA